MLFSYVFADGSTDILDAMPRLPVHLQSGHRSIDVMGLVDSGATVNILPYSVGLALGNVWDERKTLIRLAGNLAAQRAIPLFLLARVGDFIPVQLAFAWVKAESPVLLGQTNFFTEFEVCFYRTRSQFDVRPRSS